MQFQLLIEQALKNDQKYQQLRRNLKLKQEKCLKRAQSIEHQLYCKKEEKNFMLYLDQYIFQYREKGVKICFQVMRQHSGLEEKIKAKDQCIQFYHKSANIFLGNVRDKLRSLVDNIDFSQL